MSDELKQILKQLRDLNKQGFALAKKLVKVAEQNAKLKFKKAKKRIAEPPLEKTEQPATVAQVPEPAQS